MKNVETLMTRPVDVSLLRYLREEGFPDDDPEDYAAIRIGYNRWVNETFHQCQREARSVGPAAFRARVDSVLAELDDEASRAVV